VVVDAPQRSDAQPARQLGDVAVANAAQLAVRINHEAVRSTAGAALERLQHFIIFVIAGGEPQRPGGRLSGEDGVGFRAGLGDEPRADFERVLLRVALRGLIEAAVTEVANLQQAVQGDAMLTRPRLRQLERGQDTAVQVAEDEIN